MFKAILVPLDGSSLAEQAIDPALAIARSTQAKIILVAVAINQSETRERVEKATGLDEKKRPQDIEISKRAYLQAVQSRYNMRNLVVQLATFKGQDVAAILVDFSVAEAVDLVVMSTHSRSALGRWTTGSVTSRVVAHAPCPVVALRDHHPIQNILLPLDGSDLAEMAIAPTQTIAKALGSRVTILNVASGENEFARHPQKPKAYIESVAAACQAQHIEAKATLLQGDPANCIIDYSADNKIDLIVMATHGRTGYQRWQFGSVTDRVLRHTPISTLAVRRKV